MFPLTPTPRRLLATTRLLAMTQPHVGQTRAGLQMGAADAAVSSPGTSICPGRSPAPLQSRAPFFEPAKTTLALWETQAAPASTLLPQWRHMEEHGVTPPPLLPKQRTGAVPKGEAGMGGTICQR